MRDPSRTRLRAQIRPAAKHMDWLRCLLHIHRELARLGMQIEDLKPYQRDVLGEITAGPDENRIAELHDWWLYDHERLRLRGQGYGQPAKPRIDISMHFTKRGNFAVEWKPTGTMMGKPGPDSDWKHWLYREAYFADRPSAELVFIRALSGVDNQFRHYSGPAPRDADPTPVAPEVRFARKRCRSDYQREDRAVDSIILQAAAGLGEGMALRLALNFEVTFRQNVFLEWKEFKQRDAPSGVQERLVAWDIENVMQRTARFEQVELNGLPKSLDCTVEQVMAAYREVSGRSRGGPSNEYTLPARVSKLLQKQGRKKAATAGVRRFLELLRKHQPELFPAPPAPPPGPNVLPFKRS